MQLFIPTSRTRLRSLMFFLGIVTACAGAYAEEHKVQIVPVDARIQMNGTVLDNGSFTLWDQGTIGDYLVVPSDTTIRISVRAAAQAQNDIPARLAVELMPIDGEPMRVGVLEVSSERFSYRESCDYANYALKASLARGFYEVRITHLNRTVKEGTWRHCFISKLHFDGATRAACSPEAYAFFGVQTPSRTAPDEVGAEVVETEHLRVDVFPDTAEWSVLQRGSGNRAAGIRPAIRIADLPVDLGSYDVEFNRKNVDDKTLGHATQFQMQYRRAGELDVTYTLVISHNASEIVMRIDFVNQTGRQLVVDSVAPFVATRVSFGGETGDWTLIGDGKQYRDPYRIMDVAKLDEFQCWWYAALKARNTGRSILLGSLRNEKGLGRFLVADGGDAAVKMCAYHDYERITMPPDASIRGEPTLLQFDKKGTDSLERFGELVAAAHEIHLQRDFPLDPHNPVAETLFNSWGGYGASVVSRFPYKNDADPAKRRHAYRNKKWNQANRNQLYSLGLNKYGYAGGAWNRLAFLKQRPLARRYGQVDEFEGNAPLLEDRPGWYRQGRIDFSNPEVIEFERRRITEAIEQSRARETGAMLIYNWDFTNEWQTLPDQYDSFLTGAETYRTALKLWRDLSEATPGGSCGCVYMNSIGINYGLAKIMRVGEDSDRGYYGDDVFTQGCTFTEGLVRQLSGRYFYNGRVFWINPDSFHVFVGGLYDFQLAKTHASFCAIAGNRITVAEPFTEYDADFPEDRLEIARRVAPTTGDVAVAVDVFEHCPARLWNMPIRRPFGEWNVVALFNTDHDHSGLDIRQTIRFDDLELSADTEYLVHEFWSNRFLGIHKGSFERTLRAPDCEVYSIVPMRDHPVLVSTSRHVRQMAYEVLDLAWDPNTLELYGKSKVVQNDPYQLRVFVPEGYDFGDAMAGDLEITARTSGMLLTITFKSPRDEVIEWRATFRRVD